MTTINIDWLRNEISEAEKKVGFNSTSLTQRINESRLLTLKSVLEVCKEVNPEIKIENFQKLKEQIIKDANIDVKTMHIFGMAVYFKRLTVKEFFEFLETTIRTINTK